MQDMRNSIDRKLAKLDGTLPLRQPGGLLAARGSRRRFVVYRMFDVDGVLLYVGKSKRWARRFRQHEDAAGPWIDRVVTMRLQDFPDELAMDAAEIEIITDERPLYNCETRETPFDLSEEELAKTVER